MRLPVLVPAVIREAFQQPAAWILGALAPSVNLRFTSSNVESATINSMSCSYTPCNCQGTNAYACCSENTCHWTGTMCACGQGGTGPSGLRAG